MKPICVMIISLALLSVSGCACFNRSDSVQVRSTTVGKELMDLDEARTKGVITASEYEIIKNNIIGERGNYHYREIKIDGQKTDK